MPLSEDEQRILREIEQQFYDTDPAFARGVGTTTLYRHGLQQMKLAVLLFVVGLGVLVWMLVMGNALGAFALGAVPMFAAALDLRGQPPQAGPGRPAAGHQLAARPRHPRRLRQRRQAGPWPAAPRRRPVDE